MDIQYISYHLNDENSLYSGINEEKSISDVVKRSQNFVNKIIVCDPITHSAGVISSFLELSAINYPLRF